MPARRSSRRCRTCHFHNKLYKSGLCHSIQQQGLCYAGNMRFICVQCGMKDNVIGDEAPLCLVCKVPLVKATDTYAGIYMSPSMAMRRFESSAEKHGYEKALTGRVKQEREAWI